MIMTQDNPRESEQEQLARQVAEEGDRIERSQRAERSIFAKAAYVGVLGVSFVLPVVAGAYVGLWLDGHLAGYSTRWTVSLMVLGVVLGAVNVYVLLRQ